MFAETAFQPQKICGKSAPIGLTKLLICQKKIENFNSEFAKLFATKFVNMHNA